MYFYFFRFEFNINHAYLNFDWKLNWVQFIGNRRRYKTFIGWHVCPHRRLNSCGGYNFNGIKVYHLLPLIDMTQTNAKVLNLRALHSFEGCAIALRLYLTQMCACVSGCRKFAEYCQNWTIITFYMAAIQVMQSWRTCNMPM